MEDKTLQIDDLIVNAHTSVVKRRDQTIRLTPLEYKLLYYLLQNRDTIVTREALLKHIWKYATDVQTRVVDVYVGYLRKKIDTGSSKKIIKSIRGAGYMVAE